MTGTSDADSAGFPAAPRLHSVQPTPCARHRSSAPSGGVYSLPVSSSGVWRGSPLAKPCTGRRGRVRQIRCPRRGRNRGCSHVHTAISSNGGEPLPSGRTFRRKTRTRLSGRLRTSATVPHRRTARKRGGSRISAAGIHDGGGGGRKRTDATTQPAPQRKRQHSRRAPPRHKRDRVHGGAGRNRASAASSRPRKTREGRIHDAPSKPATQHSDRHCHGSGACSERGVMLPGSTPSPAPHHVPRHGVSGLPGDRKVSSPVRGQSPP